MPAWRDAITARGPQLLGPDANAITTARAALDEATPVRGDWWERS